MRQYDVELFIAEESKTQMSLDCDHWSVFSDDDSSSLENEREASLAAIFMDDLWDERRGVAQHDNEGLGFEEWSALLSAKVNEDNRGISEGSVNRHRGDNDSHCESTGKAATADEVEEYNLAACCEKVHCRSSYDAFGTMEVGTAAQLVPNNPDTTHTDREGSVGGCLPTTTKRDDTIITVVTGDDHDTDDAGQGAMAPGLFVKETTTESRLTQEPVNAKFTAEARNIHSDGEICDSTEDTNECVAEEQTRSSVTVETDDREQYELRGKDVDEAAATMSALASIDTELVSADRRADVSKCERIEKPECPEMANGYSWLARNELTNSSRKYQIRSGGFSSGWTIFQGSYEYKGEGFRDSGSVSEDG